LSQRTDGGPASKQAAKKMTGMAYGENSDFMDLESAAPMEAAPKVEAMPPSEIVPTDRTVIPMGADSLRPQEPVTAGAPLGAGPGPEALGMPAMDDNFRANLGMYLPVLSFIANKADTSPETRDVIRQLREML
jgi:hypothetical protein